MENSNAIKLEDLFTAEQFAEESKGKFTLTGLRWQLRFRDTNGLASACIRIGKKLYISKTLYEQWLAKQVEVTS